MVAHTAREIMLVEWQIRFTVLPVISRSYQGCGVPVRLGKNLRRRYIAVTACVTHRERCTALRWLARSGRTVAHPSAPEQRFPATTKSRFRLSRRKHRHLERRAFRPEWSGRRRDRNAGA